MEFEGLICPNCSGTLEEKTIKGGELKCPHCKVNIRQKKYLAFLEYLMMNGLVNDIDFFLSHRKKIGLKAKEVGYRFIVCAPKNRNIHILTGLGLEYCEYPLSRGSRNFFKELKSFFSLFSLIHKIDPDVLHLVTIKPLVYGGLIARLKGNIPILVAFPGLGHLYTSKNIISTVSRFIVNKIYRFIFTNPNYKVIFQIQLFTLLG